MLPTHWNPDNGTYVYLKFIFNCTRHAGSLESIQISKEKIEATSVPSPAPEDSPVHRE